MIKGTYYSVYDGSSARNFIKDLENSIEGILEEINDNSKITAQFLQNEIQSLLMIESFILKYSTYSDLDCLNLPDKAMFDSESDEKMIDAIKSLKTILDDYQDILRRDIGEERENLKFLLSACSKKCEMSRENWYKYLHKIHKDINSIQPENFYPPEKETFEADVVEYLNALHFTKKSLKNQLFAKMLTMYKIMNVRKAWITHNVDNFPIEIFDFFEKKAKEDHDDRDFFMENHSDELSHKLKQLKSMIEFEGYYFSHNNEKNQLLYLEFLSGNILSVVNCENLDEKNIVKLSSYKEIVKSSESSGIIILNTSDKEIPISCPGNTKLKSLASFLKNKFENLAMKKNNEQAPPLGNNSTEMFTPSTISFLLLKILKDDGKSVVNSKKISKLIKNEDRLRNLVAAELKETMTVERKKEISPVMAFRALKSIFRMQETSILGILYQQCKDINDDEKLTSLIDIYTKLLSTKEFNILRIIIKLYENLQQKCITSKNIQHNINKNFHEMLFFPQDLTTQMVKDFDFKTNLLLRVAQSLPKAFDIKIPNAGI